jgi:hypothetical protein
MFFNQAIAQGNLQFNQLLTYQGSIDVVQANGGICNFCTASSPEWIVPSGKIWKIESISSPTAVISNPYYGVSCGEGVLFRNGHSLKQASGIIYAKAGDILKFTYNNGSCNGYGQYTYSISIIEFNIVP